MKTTETTYEISGNEFVERQTRQMAKDFKCSRPRPTNRRMGFKGKDERPKTKPW